MSLETFDIDEWHGLVTENIQHHALQKLEEGAVLFFPSLRFHPNDNELPFLSPHSVDAGSKNISYNAAIDRLSGTVSSEADCAALKEMIKRYAVTSRKFTENLFPHYASHLNQGKTSFRPVEIAGRKSSYRKDDSLLHVDAFPSNPTQGQRILRIFSNINQEGKPRVWRIGEPFTDVVEKILPRAKSPILSFAHLLKLLRITKKLRTPYDHYMLELHDKMKGDADYQKNAPQQEVHFPPGCTWIVYTDQVSHAAMSGQHVLEQTFHLPISSIKNSHTAPLSVLEKKLGRNLT